GVESLPAVEAFDVFNAIAAGDHLAAGMFASGLHNNALMRLLYPRASPCQAPTCPRVTIRVMPFPTQRLRRLRTTEAMRNLVRETHLQPGQFILPLFVCPGEGVRREIGSMPSNYQLSIDEMVKECEEIRSLGIGGVILFGLPETKDEMATGAYDENGIVQRAIRAIRKEVPGLLIMTDVC